MSLRINTNIDALTAYRNLSNTQASMSTSLERLSSGLRINRAADDAAGLAISQGLTAQINGIGQAVRNAQDGINVVQTADGALTETQSILQRMRTLSVQAANDSNDPNSRADIQTEVGQLNQELDRIAGATSFNGVSLLDGSFQNKVFQVGANNVAANDQIQVSVTSGVASGAKTSWANGAVAYTAGAAGDTVTFAYNSTTVAVDLGTAVSGSAPNGTTAPLSGDTSDANKIADALNGNQAFAKNFTAAVDDKGGLVVQARSASASSSETIVIAGTGTAALGGTSTAVGATAGSAGFSSSALGVDGIQVDTAAHAGAAIDTIDKAITAVSTARANLGALQNRFQHTINNLNVTQQNLQASNSSITDTDMASEMSNFTRAQILSQAGTSMLKQANQASQSVLSLLQ